MLHSYKMNHFPTIPIGRVVLKPDADCLNLGIIGRHDQLVDVVLACSDLLNSAEATVPAPRVNEL